jgi:hypothetical protein
MCQIDWGSAGDWVASSVALIAIFTTIWMWRKDQAKHEKEALARASEEMRADAGSVGAWFDGRAVGEGNVAVAQLVLQNQAHEPVYRWSAEVFIDPPAREFDFTSEEFGALPPYGGRIEVPIGGVVSSEILRVEIDFRYTMADGGEWRRASDGSLSLERSNQEGP